MRPTYLSPFTKAILSALFAGIVATLLCMGYDIFYRNSTGFPLSDYINVSTLIFAVNLVFLLFGGVYWFFLRFKRGKLFYSILFTLLTLASALLASKINRADVPLLNTEFHQLMIPMVVIIGLLAAIGIPLLYGSRKFEDYIL